VRNLLNRGNYWTDLLLSMKSLPVLKGIKNNLEQAQVKDYSLPNPFSATSLTDIENSLERLGLYFQASVRFSVTTFSMCVENKKSNKFVIHSILS